MVLMDYAMCYPEVVALPSMKSAGVVQALICSFAQVGLP